MIVSALYAFSLQGKSYFLTSPWLIDSTASNHMTRNLEALHNVHKYDGEQHIQITSGSVLPIIVVGNLDSWFIQVSASPSLSTNLIYVGQLVEDNCAIHFDLMVVSHDQESGEVIVIRPKVGHLFSIQSSFFLHSIYVSWSIAKNNYFWHKILGHPNSIILIHLKHGSLSNTNEFSRNVF